MPPKGWSKKNIHEGHQPPGPAPVKPVPPPSSTGITQPKKTVSVEIVTPPPLEVGPLMKAIPDDREYNKIIIIYRDGKGKEKSTSYTVSNLVIEKAVTESYSEKSRRQLRIHMNLDCDVLEEM
jgi:hypothetical protein